MSLLSKHTFRVLLFANPTKLVRFGIRPFSTGNLIFNQPKEVTNTESKESAELQTSVYKNAKESAKTASMGLVVMAGLAITGGVFFVLFKELFSGESPQSLFQQGSEKCIAHEKVQDLLGEPIKPMGEPTRRHNSKHIKHMVYQDEQGRKGLRTQFDLLGLRKSAVAEMDAREVILKLSESRASESTTLNCQMWHFFGYFHLLLTGNSLISCNFRFFPIKCLLAKVKVI